MANRIQLRRDTTSNWENINPVLADGEPGYDIVTNEVRIGDGSTSWTGLTANTISGGGSTGDVTFNGINIIGDDNLRFQPNVSATDGYIDIYLTTGPDIHIDNNSGNLILGSDSWANVRLATDGNVQIRSQDGGSTSTWTFDPGGNVTLPQGGVISETEVNSSHSILLTPKVQSGENPDMAVRIYPTFNDDDHVHITAGNPTTVDLFLGDDNQYVKIEKNAGNIVIGANNNTHNWTFGTDGNLTLPAGGQIQSESGTGNVTIEANDGNNVRTWTFETNGNITFPDATTQGTAYQRVTGSWTVTTGSANYSFTVPQNGTYVMWVRGNIPNGIITWNATATVTNNNVPVLGQQFAWNYNAFNPIVLEITALPVQFIGTANTIINANVYGGGPSNTFEFTVNNASGSPQTVYWGYVAQ